MEKLGILSRHIVLCDSTYPVHGIILIKDELIQDIIVLENNISSSEVLSKFNQWKILDYSDYYISPGLIDLNARKEWETYETFTKAAVAGGTTFVLEEPSFYNNSEENPMLFCDIGKTKLLTDENMQTPDPECIAYKAYLFQPSKNIPAVTNLQGLIEISNFHKVPLFVDPNLPDPRILYMSSPNRLEGTEERKDNEVKPTTTVFAAALSHNTKDSGEDEEEFEITENFRTVSLMDGEIDSFKSSSQEINSEEIKERSSDGREVVRGLKNLQIPPKGKHKSSNSHTIIDNLEERINRDSKNIEALCMAESNTYQKSGSTSFLAVKKEIEIEPKSAPRQRTRLCISTKAKVELATDYTFFLANCPEIWETAGIEILLSKVTQSTRMHFQNISAASSFNLIRKSADVNKNISCEISAPYLFFNSGNISKTDTRYKNSPPIRGPSNFNLLWDLLKMRVINSISSGHVLIDYYKKGVDSGSFQNALNGICSMGMSMLAIWSTINIPTMKIETLEHYLVRLGKWFSMVPAKVIGMHQRGSIAKGKLADLVVWSPYCKERVNVCKEYQELSTFNGIEMHGKIEKVYVRGKLAFDNGEFHPVGKRVAKADLE